MAEKKVRKQPFEIDKAAVKRLNKRILDVTEAKTLVAVKNHSKADIFEMIGKEESEILISLTKVLAFLTPPGGSDE